MTQTNFRKTNQSDNRTQNSIQNYYNKSEQETVNTQANNESLAIVPVEVWQPDTNKKSLGIRAKTNALAEDLAVLRSNIDIRINQLQSLIETEGAAAERAELLNEITSHIRESLNLKDIFKTVVEDARAALQTDRVVVYQFDKNWKGTVIAESVDSNWPRALGAEIADPCFADRYVEFYQKGRVKATADIYEAGLTECHISQLEPFAVRANLVAPIVANGKLLGLLIAHHCSEPRQWIESEIEFFQQLATQLGYAVDQALLLTKQKAATQQAQKLNHINVQIRKSPNIQDILTISVEETREALGCDRVIVYEFDSQWKGTVIAESVDSNWPQALGAEIADPCFADRYVQTYQRGRVKATENIYEVGLTECHINQLEQFEVKANLVAPIVVEKKLIGLLIGHQCTGPRTWTELEIDLIRKVAVQVGYALEQAYLLQKQQAAAKQARFLNEIGIKLRSSQRSEDIFDTIVEEARSALKADRVILYQFDADWNGTVVAESVDKAWPQAFGKKISEPCFKKNYLKSYLRGRVSTIENIDEAGLGECHIQLLKPFAVKANIVAPIIAEQKLHGLLIVHQCSKPRKWQESEIDFTKQLATQVGFALDQVTLLQQQQAATKQAIALNQISSNIRKSLNPQDILNTTVEDMLEVIQADRVIVYQFDPQWKGTVVAESVTVGFPEALGAEIVDPCFAQGYIKPYLKGRVKPTNDIREAGLTECHIKQLEQFKVKANLVAPIVTDKKLYGLLIAHQCSAPRNWEALEIDLIKQVAIQVGYALDQAFLLQQQQEATQQARLLSEISSRIRESLDLEKIFQTTVEESLLLMKADRIVIYRFDANWEGKIISESVKPNWSKIADMETEVPCFPTEYVEPYRQGRVQVTKDINKANLTDCHREQLEKWQVKANVVVPILVGQKLYGLLGAHQCSGTRQWQDSDVEVFKQLALQVGSTLEQALLLEQVIQARKTAETISQEQQQQKESLESQIETFLTEIENSFDGDLTVRANVTVGVMGTVADFFNATIENLQQLVLKVKSATNIVSSTTESNNAEIEKLSGEAHRQAEAITNALGQIQVMTNAVKAVAANAQQAEAKVQQANQILQTSDAAMNRSVEGIVVIQKTVEATARKVKNLGETSKKISRVLSLINDLANQTNILALNASVEATRAGQDDQGFATVASEVRSLAEQSASATQEIEQIVEEMQSGTSEVVKAMIVGRKRVMVGTQLVKGARQTLTDLLDVSAQISELVEEITLSATTQADTSSQLSTTMQEVATIANQTSEQSLTVAESFSQLLGVAGDLEKSVAEFKVN
ncbi:GAF domain-containing protein [Okeania sp. SIO1I7]|uniref:GAF domain-containing protein n=1 Tax=Okeania sp. SIO1I7 TaxID=2607772 RepID=UPI0013F9F04C|nr:GAF domain-containing protein [Okeania sp. SIO1I7]NET29492.1 GAF domain-containing protein [Okeania sp. SIO1I7]